jgi:integrase
MSRKSFKPTHLELRYKTYFALLVIPKDVRHIIGKSKFFETTGTGDIKIAQSLATLKVIKWKSEIASARTNTSDPVINSAMELSRMLKTSPAHLVHDVIEDETSRIAHEVGPMRSSIFNVIATGKRKPLTSFIDEWVKNERRRGLAEKTIAQMKSDVEILISFLPTSNLLVYEHTNLWIKHIAETAKLSPASVTRIIGSCRNFFKHLKFIGEIAEDAKEPFIVPKEFKLSKKRNSKAQNKTESWLPFTSGEVERLYSEAILLKDWTLGQLILIGAYTGARIEEICSLKKEHINLNDESFKITDAKTEAGVRVIPVHQTLLPVINELMTTSDEYIIPNLTKSKFDDRSNAIGKRFGRLKSKLGYSKRHVFHSIRKTFTTQLENAGVNENVTADIIGHEKPRMTYGLYSGGTNLAVKREAVSKVSYDFKNPKHQLTE